MNGVTRVYTWPAHLLSLGTRIPQKLSVNWSRHITIIPLSVWHFPNGSHTRKKILRKHGDVCRQKSFGCFYYYQIFQTIDDPKAKTGKLLSTMLFLDLKLRFNQPIAHGKIQTTTLWLKRSLLRSNSIRMVFFSHFYSREQK